MDNGWHKKIVYFVSEIVIIFSVLVWLLTEGLSAFYLLTPKIVCRAWGMIVLCCFCALLIKFKKYRKKNSQAERIFCVKVLCHKLKISDYVILLLGIGMAMILFYFAYITVPFNWDSMTYHLARVANWIQNASVKYYPTNIKRQLYYSSFTEYYILHICLLFQNDKFVNLVQWCAYIVSAVLIYGIADELKIKRVVAMFSALLFMLCPLAIAESQTTQVDLAGTMWILIFAYYILLIKKRENPLLQKENFKNIVLCGAAIGFGYLTKASICFMMPVFLIWLFVDCIKRKDKLKEMIICSMMAGGIIVILAMPGFIRNYKSTGDILAIEETAGNLMLKTINPKYIILNFCKNVTIEAAGEKEPDLVWQVTMKLADLLGTDIEDTEISAYQGFSEGVKKKYTHDHAGAQALFCVTGIVLLLVVGKKIYCTVKGKRIFGGFSLEDSYIAVGMCSVLLLFFGIRWQPWGTRLLFPALPFLCIFIGYAADKIKKLYIRKVFLILILASMLSDAFVTMKNIYVCAKPSIEKQDRFYLYFLNRGGAKEYEALCEEIKNYDVKKIGMLLDGDTYEYPLWVKLKNEDTVLHHVVLEQKPIWKPECIVAINRNIEKHQIVRYGEKEYECIWNYEDDSRFAILKERTD